MRPHRFLKRGSVLKSVGGSCSSNERQLHLSFLSAFFYFVCCPEDMVTLLVVSLLIVSLFCSGVFVLARSVRTDARLHMRRFIASTGEGGVRKGKSHEGARWLRRGACRRGKCSLSPSLSCVRSQRALRASFDPARVKKPVPTKLLCREAALPGEEAHAYTGGIRWGKNTYIEIK